MISSVLLTFVIFCLVPFPFYGTLSWLPRGTWDLRSGLLRVRELRSRLTRRGDRSGEVTLVTTLLDSDRYPKNADAELYGRRWQVETNLYHLKTTMRMDILRCQTVDGVQRELAVFGIVSNAVRLVMIHAAELRGVPPDRISFIDVLRWLELGCPGRDLPPFIVNPRRSRSPAPRVVRRRHDRHTSMTRPRKPQRNLLVSLERSPHRTAFARRDGAGSALSAGRSTCAISCLTCRWVVPWMRVSATAAFPWAR